MTPLPPDQFGPVVITGRDMYDTLVRISGKLDVLVHQTSMAETRDADHEQRLRMLEARPRWPLASVTTLAAVAAVVVAVIALLTH